MNTYGLFFGIAAKNIKMIKSFYIVQLSGAHQIKKVTDQPEEGFKTEGQAETHLIKLLNSNKYPYNAWYSFSIMPMYSVVKC